MKQDINIPQVTNIQLALVLEFNDDFRTYDWNAYLINKKEKTIEMVLIITYGFDTKNLTAKLRHSIAKLPANSVAKFEFLENKVLKLNNSFKVSFFMDNQLFEKDFLVKMNTISEDKAKPLDLFNGSKGFIIN
ncbi:MAG TPA: hypothetical protein EYG92_12695 [Lutibacter sp.]|nr:hypothetical protein [Lutibacter sp.]